MENVKFEEDGKIFELQCLENVRLEEKEEKLQQNIHAKMDDWNTRDENYKDKDNESAVENTTKGTGTPTIGGNLSSGVKMLKLRKLRKLKLLKNVSQMLR